MTVSVPLASLAPLPLDAQGLERVKSHAIDPTTDPLVFEVGGKGWLKYQHLFHAAGIKRPAVVALRARPNDASVPYADWPAWAKLVAKRRKSGEAGVGETFERMASAVGGKIFERAVAKLGGKCGCRARRASWDRKYPYTNLPAS